jgi:ketosteroid isomerase-like protein
MKMHLPVALAGLAVSFAMPVLAQEKNVVDPEVRQQIEAVLTNFDEAFNKKHDAVAIAALFTQDAIQVWDFEGGDTVSGQQAIEKTWAAEIATSPGEFRSKLVEVYPIGSEVSGISEWSHGVWKGYWSAIYVRDADTWKIRMEYAILLNTP